MAKVSVLGHIIILYVINEYMSIVHYLLFSISIIFV